jgi:hypothetical protein
VATSEHRLARWATSTKHIVGTALAVGGPALAIAGVVSAPIGIALARLKLSQPVLVGQTGGNRSIRRQERWWWPLSRRLDGTAVGVHAPRPCSRAEE